MTQFNTCQFCDNLIDTDYDVCEVCCQQFANEGVAAFESHFDMAYGDAYEADIYAGEYSEM